MDTAKQPWEMGKYEYLKKDPLPPMKKLPTEGHYPAVETDDGSIYVDTSQEPSTHILFAGKIGIPPERLKSGGWIQGGVYEGSFRSDTGRYAEQMIAKAKVRHSRIVHKALAEGKPVPPEVLADYPDLATPEKKKTTVAPPQVEPQQKKSKKKRTIPTGVLRGRSWRTEMAGKLSLEKTLRLFPNVVEQIGGRKAAAFFFAKKGSGTSLDDLADEYVQSGLLAVPSARNPDDYLMELILEKAPFTASEVKRPLPPYAPEGFDLDSKDRDLLDVGDSFKINKERFVVQRTGEGSISITNGGGPHEIEDEDVFMDRGSFKPAPVYRPALEMEPEDISKATKKEPAEQTQMKGMPQRRVPTGTIRKEPEKDPGATELEKAAAERARKESQREAELTPKEEPKKAPKYDPREIEAAPPSGYEAAERVVVKFSDFDRAGLFKPIVPAYLLTTEMPVPKWDVYRQGDPGDAGVDVQETGGLAFEEAKRYAIEHLLLAHPEHAPKKEPQPKEKKPSPFKARPKPSGWAEGRVHTPTGTVTKKGTFVPAGKKEKPPPGVKPETEEEKRLAAIVEEVGGIYRGTQSNRKTGEIFEVYFSDPGSLKTIMMSVKHQDCTAENVKAKIVEKRALKGTTGFVGSRAHQFEEKKERDFAEWFGEAAWWMREKGKGDG